MHIACIEMTDPECDSPVRKMHSSMQGVDVEPMHMLPGHPLDFHSHQS